MSDRLGGSESPFSFGSFPEYASGVVADGPSIFGEKGPEAAVPLPDGRSIPVALRMPQIPTAAPQGGTGGPVTINHSPTYNVTPAQGVTPAQLAAVINRNNAKFARNIVSTVRNAQMRYRG